MNTQKTKEPGFLTFKRNHDIMKVAEKRAEELEEKIERGVSKKEKARLKKEIATLSAQSRRAAIKTLGGLGALIAGTILGVNVFSDNDHKDQKEEPTKPKPEAEKKQKPELPDITVLEEKVKFQKPEGLKMEDQEYTKYGQQIIPEINKLISPDGEKIKDQVDQKTFELLKNIASVISKTNPAFAEQWEKFDKEWDQNIWTYYKEINRYLMSWGYFLEIESYDGHGTNIHLTPINNSKYIQLKDSEGVYKIKVIEAEGGPGPVPIFQGHSATYNQHVDAVVVYRDRIKATIDRIQSDIPDLPNLKLKLNKKKLYEKLIREFTFHEAIHAYLFKKFPNISSNDQFMGRFLKKFGFSFDVLGQKIDYSGGLSPLMAHELCALGGQLATSEVEIPITLTMFIQDPSTVPENHKYKLIYQLLPYFTLEAAPPSEIRDKIMLLFKGTGQMRVSDTMLLAGNTPFKREHTQKAGKRIYETGYNILFHLNAIYESK